MRLQQPGSRLRAAHATVPPGNAFVPTLRRFLHAAPGRAPVRSLVPRIDAFVPAVTDTAV